MNELKTVSDLNLEPRMSLEELNRFPTALYNEYVNAKQARMNFDNGYGVSVLIGSMFYSNGVDTYEVGILRDGSWYYHTPITSNMMGITEDEVTNIMKQVQELPTQK